MIAIFGCGEVCVIHEKIRLENGSLGFHINISSWNIEFYWRNRLQKTKTRTHYKLNSLWLTMSTMHTSKVYVFSRDYKQKFY